MEWRRMLRTKMEIKGTVRDIKALVLFLVSRDFGILLPSVTSFENSTTSAI
jgi:hypothetical protein